MIPSKTKLCFIILDGIILTVLVRNILICMQKHSQHNEDERTLFFRKIYISFYSKGLQKGYERVIVWEAS